jgi:hypothetical protein
MLQAQNGLRPAKTDRPGTKGIADNLARLIREAASFVNCCDRFGTLQLVRIF